MVGVIAYRFGPVNVLPFNILNLRVLPCYPAKDVAHGHVFTRRVKIFSELGLGCYECLVFVSLGLLRRVVYKPGVELVSRCQIRDMVILRSRGQRVDVVEHLC